MNTEVQFYASGTEIEVKVNRSNGNLCSFWIASTSAAQGEKPLAWQLDIAQDIAQALNNSVQAKRVIVVAVDGEQTDLMRGRNYPTAQPGRK